MEVKKKYSVEKDVVVEIFCDRCGKPQHVPNWHNPPNSPCFRSYAHIDIVWGYFSKKDGERHTFDLCETCYDELVTSAKILVHTTNYF